jgi:hypothetical protein
MSKGFFKSVAKAAVDPLLGVSTLSTILFESASKLVEKSNNVAESRKIQELEKRQLRIR